MTKNAWILVNRYCLTFNIYRPFLVDSSDKLYEKTTSFISTRMHSNSMRPF